MLRGAGRCAGATGLDAGQPNGFVPDDDRVGRRVGASQQQGVGRMSVSYTTLTLPPGDLV